PVSPLSAWAAHGPAMRHAHRSPLVAAALVAALTAFAPAFVPGGVALAGDRDHIEARELLRRGEILPLNQILQIVQRRVPGDVIDVELERDDGVWEYEIKV